jgi:hypothetical protein
MQLTTADSDSSISDQAIPQNDSFDSALVRNARSLLASTDSETIGEALGDAGVAALFTAVSAEWGDDCLQCMSSQLTAAEAVDLLDRFQRNRARSQATVTGDQLKRQRRELFRLAKTTGNNTLSPNFTLKASYASP